MASDSCGSEKMKPLISIGLAVYNGGATLDLAVQSIIEQSYCDWELIILDDASSDNSVEIMRGFDDERIIRVEGDSNIGLSARLNMAVDMASGMYFARMDQDDVSFPQRLEKQLAYLESHPGVDLLSTNVIVFENGGKALGQWRIVDGSHEAICQQPWRGFYMAHPTWMGKTSWFRKNRYHSSADGAEDQELLLRSFGSSRFACLAAPLLGYRENRSLEKMFRARRRVLFAFVQFAYRNRDYAGVLKILMIQTIKICGDFLQHGFGFSRFRNPLQPLNPAMQSLWNHVYQHLNLKSQSPLTAGVKQVD